MRKKATRLLGFALMMSIAFVAFGQGETTVVPEIFLRGYDPITVFFPQNTGPMNGGPADDPGNLLKIKPDIPVNTVGWTPKPPVSSRHPLASTEALYHNGQG